MAGAHKWHWSRGAQMVTSGPDQAPAFSLNCFATLQIPFQRQTWKWELQANADLRPPFNEFLTVNWLAYMGVSMVFKFWAGNPWLGWPFNICTPTNAGPSVQILRTTLPYRVSASISYFNLNWGAIGWYHAANWKIIDLWNSHYHCYQQGLSLDILDIRHIRH